MAVDHVGGGGQPGEQEDLGPSAEVDEAQGARGREGRADGDEEGRALKGGHEMATDEGFGRQAEVRAGGKRILELAIEEFLEPEAVKDELFGGAEGLEGAGEGGGGFLSSRAPF